MRPPLAVPVCLLGLAACLAGAASPDAGGGVPTAAGRVGEGAPASIGLAEGAPVGAAAEEDTGADASARPAAEADSLTPGLRIRVRSSRLGARRAVGEVVAVDDETVRVRFFDSAEPIVLRRSSIRELEVSLGRRSRARAGAKVGAFVLGSLGVVGGYFLGGAANIDCENSCSPGAPFAGSLMVGALGAGTGALLGAVVGTTMETERWQAAPTGRVGVRVLPGRRPGLAASWSIQF
jgi:hypothetical protein